MWHDLEKKKTNDFESNTKVTLIFLIMYSTLNSIKNTKP